MTYIPLPSPTCDAPSADTCERVRTEGVRVLDYQCPQTASAASTHDRYHELSIVLVRAGAFCYADHGYTRVLEPGAVVLGCAGDDYRCTHTYGCGDRGTIFQFSEAAIAGLQHELAGRAVPRAAVFAQAPRLEALAAVALARAATLPLAFEEAAYGLAASVLGALDGRAIEVPPSWRPADRDRAHAGAEFIEQRHAEALSLQEMAAGVASSPFHFLRIFRQELGLTPHQYLLRTRLRHAIRLLTQTDRLVTDIALEVGFGDLTNFIRTFRAHVGDTPAAFRLRAG